MRLSTASLGIILFIISFPAIADESNKTNYGISFSSSGQLAIRKSVNDSVMLYTGIGLANNQQGGGFSYTFNSYGLTLGARNYLSKDNLDNLSRFINLELSRGRTSYSGDIDQQVMSTSANIAYGIEYFLSSNLSIEGSAGIGISWGEVTQPASSYSTRYSSFPNGRLALTYYW